ncbi:HAD family hydrolase [Sediminibacillus massiliensis]|uniref:HAD family hydrolase n=1 Tax=Sediminibacillus massiliensis TaxID=1926277 RepID=UPI0009887445|nr:HAD family hydrolase [Sediminibacillus massiliensis]
MLKAVFFDLDGTLLNRDESLMRFIEEQYVRFSKELEHIPKQEFISRFIKLDNRGYVWKDVVYRQLIAEFEVENLTWQELLQDYLEKFPDYAVPFPKLHKVLEALKNEGMKLGIITNGKGKFQLDNIKALEIECFFDVILISEFEGVKKPEPEIFLRAVRQLQIRPEEAIFVGDHPENDIEAASNTGMKGIWKRDDHWDNVQVENTIDGLAELPAFIKQLN